MLGHLTDTTQIPDQIGTVTGWRHWDVDEQGRLVSPVLKSIWEPGAPVHARHGGEAERAMCSDDCHCGVNAYASEDDLLASAYGVRPYRDGVQVHGSVQMWGRVREYSQGWRAEFAYPERLHATLYVSGRDDQQLAQSITQVAQVAQLAEHYQVPVELRVHISPYQSQTHIPRLFAHLDVLQREASAAGLEMTVHELQHIPRTSTLHEMHIALDYPQLAHLLPQPPEPAHLRLGRMAPRLVAHLARWEGMPLNILAAVALTYVSTALMAMLGLSQPALAHFTEPGTLQEWVRLGWACGMLALTALTILGAWQASVQLDKLPPAPWLRYEKWAGMPCFFCGMSAICVGLFVALPVAIDATAW